MIRQNIFQIHTVHRTFKFITSYLLLAISLGSCSGGGGGGGGGTAPPPQYSISGGVTSGGSGLTGTTMALTGTSSASTNTGSNGTYQFTGLSNGPYVITPSKAGYAFNPPNSAVTVSNANISGQNFVATLMTWAKAYGGGNKDVAHSIQQTSDGGFIVAGETFNFGAVNGDVWVLKLGGNGDIQWQKVYGGNGLDIAHSIQQTSDGGYIVAGESSSFDNATEVWILKLDGNGAIQWQNRYGGSGDDIAYSIQQTSSDGGYIVAGETTSFGAGGVDAFVLKLDTNGGVVWLKTYGDALNDRARSIQQTSDGFIVTGETNSFSAAGDFDIWVLKLNASGDVVWQETLGGTKDDTGYSVQQTSDGGYIVAGETNSFGAGLADVCVLKLDSNGIIEWGKSFGGPGLDRAFSIHKTFDDRYVIAGKTSPGPTTSDMWVLKLDSNGDVVWQQTYGGQGSHSANFVRQNLDGGYIVAGETSLGAGDADAWVLKLDGNGNIGSGCPIVGTSNVAGVAAGFNKGSPSVSGVLANAAAHATLIPPLDSAATTATQCSFP